MSENNGIMMRLVYLEVNAAWSFTFGDDLIRMGDAPMFHPTRRSALYAALDCGMLVTSDGQVLRLCAADDTDEMGDSGQCASLADEDSQFCAYHLADSILCPVCDSYGAATVREDSCGECAVNGDAHKYWGE